MLTGVVSTVGACQTFFVMVVSVSLGAAGTVAGHRDVASA
jgi:hypothetical protein